MLLTVVWQRDYVRSIAVILENMFNHTYLKCHGLTRRKILGPSKVMEVVFMNKMSTDDKNEKYKLCLLLKIPFALRLTLQFHCVLSVLRIV